MDAKTDEAALSTALHGADQIAPLTGLRGVAVCLVLVGHAIDSSFYYEPAVWPFSRALALLGMSLFFTLSGFVIQYNYARLFQTRSLGVATRQFFAARFARLYPLFLVGLVCWLPALPMPVAWPVTISYLTLTQSWFNTEVVTFISAWSISTEWFFYAAFVGTTFVVAAIRRPLPIFAVYCAVVACALTLVFANRDRELALLQTIFWHGDGVSADPWSWLTYFSPYVRVFEFIAGMLMAQAYLLRQRVAPFVLPLGLIIIAALDIAAPLDIPFARNLAPNFLFAPFLALVLLHLCQHKSRPRDVLSSTPMLFLGEISYSIYVVSFLVIVMLGQMFVKTEGITQHYFNSGIKVLAVCGLTVAFAYGSYHLIEAPSRRWLRKKLAVKS